MEEVHSNRHLLARTSPQVGVSVRLRRSPCLPVQILPRLGARPCRPWRIAVELPQVFDRGVEVRGFVYTARDVAGNVLYVGVTRNVERRMKAHRRSSRWWRLHSTLEVEEFATLEEAADAEDRAICRHDPPFNVRGGHPAAPWDCPGRRCRRLRSEADRVALANRRRWGGVRRGWSPTPAICGRARIEEEAGLPGAGVERCGRGGGRGCRGRVSPAGVGRCGARMTSGRRNVPVAPTPCTGLRKVPRPVPGVLKRSAALQCRERYAGRPPPPGEDSRVIVVGQPSM